MSIESRSKQYGAIFGDWHIGKKLGSGSNGKSAVFELYRNHEGWQERSALKVISLIEEQGNQADMSEYRRNEYSTVSQNRRSAAEQEVRLMDRSGARPTSWITWTISSLNGPTRTALAQIC